MRAPSSCSAPPDLLITSDMENSLMGMRSPVKSYNLKNSKNKQQKSPKTNRNGQKMKQQHQQQQQQQQMDDRVRLEVSKVRIHRSSTVEKLV